MSEPEYYIGRINSRYPPNIRRGRKVNILEITLLKICSPSAMDKIEAKMNEAYEAGYLLLAITSRQKGVANDMPNEDIRIALRKPENTRTGASKRRHDAARESNPWENNRIP